MFCKYFFTVIILRISIVHNIIFPFKYINKSEKSFLNQSIYQNLITELYIGTPSQKININLNLKDYRFYIANNICYNNSISYFLYSKSLSFENKLPAVSPFDDLEDASFAIDRVVLYDSIDLEKNITIDKFKFYFYRQYKFKENSNIFCGNMGLSINLENLNLDYYDENDFLPSIFSTLKSNDIINKYSWTYEFFDKDNFNNKYSNNIIINKNIIDDYDGLIIIGKYPHEYNPSIYSGHDLYNIYSDIKSYKTLWNFNFEKIYYSNFNDNITTNIKDKNINKKDNIINMNEKQAALIININYIISTKEFFDSIRQNFFDFYINKKICKINNLKIEYNDYDIISCNKKNFTKNIIKQFPSINFKHSEFNYIFTLTYDDLFGEKDEEIFFLILYQNFNYKLWMFGKLFLKKFHFSFNTDSNTIHFYSNYDEILLKRKNYMNKNDSKGIKIKIILICIGIFIISIIIGILIGKKITSKKLKKGANELQDNFSYKAQNENIYNDINKNNNNFQTNIEMNIKSKLFD